MASSLDSLLGFANLLGQVRGQTQTTTQSGGKSTQTTQTQLDQAAIDRMIQQMMAGQGGQASISGAARSSGLYDSTTEQQMLNDLNARVAGEVAQRSAPTVTETETDPVTQVTEVPGMGLGGLGTALGVASLAKPLLEGGMSMLSGQGSAIQRALAPSADLGSIIAGPSLGSSLGDTIGQGLSGIIGSLGNVSQAAGTGSSLLSSGLGSLSDFASTSFSAPLSSTAPSVMSGATGSLGPLLSVLDPNANAFSVTSSFVAPMLASMGPIGAVAAAVLPVFSSLLGGSVVCTALAKRGLLDKDLYAAGSEYINTISSRALNGYYLWGKPLAKQIDKGNKIAIALALPFARQRTALLAGRPAWRNPLGVITKYIGEPACYVIGYVQEKVNGFSPSYKRT